MIHFKRPVMSLWTLFFTTYPGGRGEGVLRGFYNRVNNYECRNCRKLNFREIIRIYLILKVVTKIAARFFAIEFAATVKLKNS